MIAIFPELAACAATGDVERLAVLVRRYYGGGATAAPQPSVEALVTGAGLTLRHMPLPSLGALVGSDERGAFRVVAIVSDKVDESARRFLIAHLLGHFLLDIQPLIARGDWQRSGYQEVTCPLKRFIAGGTDARGVGAAERAREARADQFAAALLLPRGMVKRALERLDSPERTAAFFGVTKACLMRRMAEIGLAPNEPVNFLDAERQIGAGPPPADAAGADPKAGALAERWSEVSPMPRAYAASSYGATERATRREGSAGDATMPAAVQAPLAGSAANAPRATLVVPRARAANAPVSDAGGGSAPPRAAPTTGVPSGRGAAPVAPVPPPALAGAGAPPAAGGRGAGMERLRELARQLEKRGAPAKSD